MHVTGLIVKNILFNNSKIFILGISFKKKRLNLCHACVDDI